MIYDNDFYDEIQPAARSSAVRVVPILLDLLRPTSVVDVGCGRGDWLAEFQSHGCDDVVGLDGPHIDPSSLAVPGGCIRSVDLLEPPALNRGFDLALCLEVAEHLPADRAASFISYLTSLAPIVVFSAAIPGQGGVDHVNEQWPAYWSALFAQHGYAPVDILRPAIWNEPEVACYYAQNMLLFVSSEAPDALAAGWDSMPSAPTGAPLALVHPRYLELVHSQPRRQAPPSLSRLLRSLPPAASRAARRRLWRR